MVLLSRGRRLEAIDSLVRVVGGSEASVVSASGGFYFWWFLLLVGSASGGFCFVVLLSREPRLEAIDRLVVGIVRGRGASIGSAFGDCCFEVSLSRELKLMAVDSFVVGFLRGIGSLAGSAIGGSWFEVLLSREPKAHSGGKSRGRLSEREWAVGGLCFIMLLCRNRCSQRVRLRGQLDERRNSRCRFVRRRAVVELARRLGRGVW